MEIKMYRTQAFMLVVLLSISGNLMASSNTLLPDVKALALDKLVLDRSDAPVTVLETSPITNSKGEVAQGMTEVTLTLDASAKNAIIIQGKTLQPGKSISLVQDLSATGGALKIPTYPAISHKAGISHYTIDIPKVTAKLCADDYTHDKSANNCFKVNTVNLVYDCPDSNWQATGDLRNCTQQTTIAKGSCPSGLSSNGDGTCSKSEYMPTASQCIAGYTYSTTNNRCEKTEVFPSTKICPAGYTYSSTYKDCRATETRSASYGCPSGWTNRGSYCSRTTTSRPGGDRCPRGYVGFKGDSITKSANGNVNLDATQTKCFKQDNTFCSDPSRYWVTDFNGDICHTYTKKSVPLDQDCPADYPHVSYWNKPYNKTCGKATPTEVPSQCPSGATKYNWGDACAFPSDFVDVTPVTTEETTSKVYSCPSGWSRSGSTCSRTTTAAMTDSCPAGTTNLNNGNCSRFLTDPVEWVCTNPEYSKLTDTSCEKVTVSNLVGQCPTNYVKNGNKCDFTSSIPAGESCAVGFSKVANECIKSVYSSPSCPDDILSSSCICSGGTTLNESSWMCEGAQKSSVLKTCPAGYTLNGNQCSYSNQVDVVFDYCPAGMTTNGSNCQFSSSISATKSCTAPFAVVSGQCQYIDYKPAGYGGSGVEAKTFEGDFVAELSRVELESTEFDAVVSQVNEIAIDVSGGCRLVSSEAEAKGAIRRGDVPCSLIWKNLPDGLTGNNKTLSGIFKAAGTYKLGYQLKGFSGSSTDQFLISTGELTVNVNMPTKPVVTDITTRLMNKVVSGFEVYNYDASSRISITTAIVEPKNYEQSVEIESVGNCDVPANATSCNVYSSESFVRDPDNLTFDSVYKVWGNSKVGGWDKAELTAKDWTIHHDFRGPSIEFSEFNSIVDNPPILNESLGFPVSVKGGEGAIGVTNFRAELSSNERWWKPTKVELEFLAVDGKHSVSTISANGTDVTFEVPNSTGDNPIISNYEVLEELGGNAYPFRMKSLTPGLYTVKISAKDAYNNTSISTVDNIQVATPKPQIKFVHKKRPVSETSVSTINMLDDVMVVAHNGFEGDTTITSIKIDGRNALTTNSEGYFKLLTGEGFDLSANQTYLMEVEAEDTNGSTTVSSISFNYLRMMFGFQRKPSTVIQLVEDVNLKVSRTQGLRCDLYGTKSAAALAANNYNHACYIEWTSLPDGLTPEVATYQASAVGGVNILGENKVGFDAYIVNKDGKASKIVSDEVTFTSIEPKPISMALDERLKLAEGVYSISVMDRQIGRYQGTSSRANIDVELSNDSGDTKQYKHNQLPFGETQNFSSYADKLGDAKLWDKVPYQLTGEYRLAPQLSDTVNFDLVVTPHPYMQVIMDLDSPRYASTESIEATIKLGIKNNLSNTFEYNVETMGIGWDVYIAFKKGTEYEAITDSVQIGTDGKGVIKLDADVIFSRNEAIYAIAEARSPYPEIQIQRVSIPRSITVVKGTAVEGEIVSRIVHSRIPANFDLRFDTQSFQDFLVMGDIEWQKMDGSSWVNMPDLSGRQYASIKSITPETLDIRAVITNKETGAITETETIRLVSFDKPMMKIEGISQAISGQAIELTAVDNDTTPQGDTVVEWSLDGENWEQGFDKFTVNIEESNIKVHGRMKYANTADDITAGQWSKAIKYISVTKPKPIILSMVKPSMAEVGTEIELKMMISNSFAGTGIPLKTEWFLPDGTTVNDINEIKYELVESDLDELNRVSVTAKAWLEGFKNVTLGESVGVMNTFSYQFPDDSDLSLTVNNNIKFVPSTGFATVNMPYINAPGVRFTYDWTFDDTAIEKVTANGKGMNFKVIEAGVHSIMVTVSDNRGNFAHINDFVDAVEPNDLEFKMNEVFSNKYKRAPLTASIYPNVKVGHPYDFVKEYVWTVNGVQGEISNRAIGAFNDLDVGHYEIDLDVKTNFGQTGKTSFSIDVFANKIPVCSPSIRKQYGVHIVDANCKDEDGKITYYRWVVNGTVFSPYGSQVRFNENDYPSASITIEAVDDAGGIGVGQVNF
ncbi:Ig-like domain-containing protein [Shewanella sp. UCD-KL12]|uniref:Ig-like domain-containing protein n=1 Tax=Shewanella sp. UCD-KL12 TaxID=1917163 RepID=UPI0011810572|nr:Ig-like domain-containing protein [Shewanella sp. UCD-KL12]